MTSANIHNDRSGNAEAIATMVDFYGGAGTFASWPSAVHGSAVKTTPTNIVDWHSAYDSERSCLGLLRHSKNWIQKSVVSGRVAFAPKLTVGFIDRLKQAVEARSLVDGPKTIELAP